MNRNIFNSAIVLIFCLGFTGLAQAFVGTIAVSLGKMEEIGEINTSFSGDAILETEEMTTTTRVYYQPGMVRDEMNVAGQQMVTIRRFDKGTVWMILGQGMYTETAVDEQNDRAPEYRLVSRERIGPEVVNGMQTTKYKSVYESADGKFGGFTWFTDDNIAVKGFMVSESKGEKERIKFEFTSLNRGKQPGELFELPPGAQKFNMAGLAGLQGMGQQGGYNAPPAGAVPAPQAPQGAAAGSGAEAASEQSPEGEDNLADVAVDEAQQTTEDVVVEETRRGVRDTITKGFGKIFGR